jgi:hypothetical protein
MIALNAHAPTEDKIDDIQNRFCGELEHYLFDKFPKYYMIILLGDFNAKVGREDIFKLTIGNDNVVRVVNFATSKNLTVKSTTFPHRNIHKFIGHLLMGRRTTKLTILSETQHDIQVHLMSDR